MGTCWEALQRVLSDELDEISTAIELSQAMEVEKTVEMKESPTYGIRTRYLRSTFKAGLIGRFQPRVLACSSEHLRIEMPTNKKLQPWLRGGLRASIKSQEEAIQILSQFD